MSSRRPAGMAPARRTRVAIEAEKELEFSAVCMVGYTKKAPRYMGDNQGAQPVKFSVTANPVEIAKKPDLESPFEPVRVLEFVWLESDRHAKRLKETLDDLLLGTSSESRLRHAWRDIEGEPDKVWTELLSQALQLLNVNETVTVFGEKERQRRIERQKRIRR